VKGTTGRALWELLHAFVRQYPLQPTRADVAGAEYFFRAFANAVKTTAGACRCAQEWQAMIAAVPPPFHSGEDLFVWTLAAHDRINAKLGKPLFCPGLTRGHALLS